MDNDVMMFGQVMMIILLSLAGLVVIGFTARYLWQLGSRPRPLPIATGEDATRLQRLEHAVESIAIEVERISEGQRFTVALLSERLPARAGEALGAGGPRRVNTPH